jgi:hypothetical protein
MALRALVLFRSWKAPAPLTGVAWLQWWLLELRREERFIARNRAMENRTSSLRSSG